MSIIGGISSMCLQAIPSLVIGDFGTCANIRGLLPLASASGDIVAPLTQYIDGLCTAEACSSQTLSNASAVISQGCAQDIQEGDTTVLSLYALIQNFGGFKDLLCTQYVSNGSYCLPEIISGYQNATGTNLTFDIGTLSGTGLEDAPASVVCSDCSKAFVIQTQALAGNLTSEAGSAVPSGTTTASASAATSSLDPTAIQAQANQTLIATCGASFLDGVFPPTVRIAGQNSTTNGTTTAIPSGTSAAGTAAIPAATTTAA